MKRLPSVILGGMVAVGGVGCRGTTNDAQVKNTVSVDPEDRAPVLGGGYDSLSQFVLGTPSCVTGTVTTENTGRSDVKLTQAATAESMMKEMTSEVKGTPRVLFFNSFAGGLYRSINSSESSIDVVYNARVVQSSERLAGVSIKPEYKDLKPLQVLEQCGDEYVAQINRGGILSIALKFDFGSVQNRDKWQSILNLAGAIQELSKDLKKKSEKNTVDGTLTVTVRQVGGSPNQALMSAKTCSMSSPSDLETCQKLVEDVLAYANQSFPSQIQSNPAVLNFVTVSMRNVGVRGLPDIDDKILGIRRDLELKLKDHVYLKSMAELSRSMTLPFDTQLEADLDFNQAVIKDTARACYNYELVDTLPTWNRCLEQYKRLNDALKPIEKKQVLVNRLVVPAAASRGELIVNQSTDKMNIVYSIDPKALWDFGTSRKVVPSDGIDRNTGQREACPTSCLVTSANKGTLLIRKGSGYQTAGSTGTAEFYPGEAVEFVMNDERSMYADNKGAITVYWRCVSCKDGTQERPTSRLVVPANVEAGVAFKSREKGQAKYSVMAYGEWTNASTWSDARGLSSDCGPTCPAPQGKDQALVVKKGSKPGEALGTDGQVTLDAGETAYFMINDDKGGYRDNKGELELVLQCVSCP
jgi:hypothetical protein